MSQWHKNFDSGWTDRQLLIHRQTQRESRIANVICWIAAITVLAIAHIAGWI